MGYVLLYAAGSIAATIFECTPIERVWDHAIDGTCVNLTAFWYTNAVANILGDFGILLLPMPVVKSLQLPSRQKWGLTMVFGLGVLYVPPFIASVIQAHHLQRLYHIGLADDNAQY